MPAPGKFASRRAIGAAGEDAALAWLCERGMQPVARNAAFAFGEIDLIVRDGATVVFVEVRQRRNDHFGGAAASVDRRKCGRIARAASAWLASHPALAQAPCRFDVLALSGRDADIQIEWIRDAFTLDDIR